MSCKCIAKMNKRLAEKNTKLDLGLLFPVGGKPRESLIIAVEKIDRKARGRASHAIATFCPFCGMEYEPKKTLSTISPRKLEREEVR